MNEIQNLQNKGLLKRMLTELDNGIKKTAQRKGETPLPVQHK